MYNNFTITVFYSNFWGKTLCVTLLNYIILFAHTLSRFNHHRPIVSRGCCKCKWFRGFNISSLTPSLPEPTPSSIIIWNGPVRINQTSTFPMSLPSVWNGCVYYYYSLFCLQLYSGKLSTWNTQQNAFGTAFRWNTYTGKKREQSILHRCGGCSGGENGGNQEGWKLLLLKTRISQYRWVYQRRHVECS